MGTDLAIGIVGHHARRDTAERLAATVDADYLSIDGGTLGCTANHMHVWQQLARYNSTWSVVLEDDAQPVDNFRDQLAALDTAPTPIVSLYLGTSRPAAWQIRIRRAINEADRVGACYITAPLLLHAVAVAMRTDLIDDMISQLPQGKPIDNAISEWARKHNICYTWPSLVDHTDGPTLVKHTYNALSQPRKAWRTAARSTWTSATVAL